MKIAFLHQNFPGQYLHLAPALAAAGHEVVALCMHDRPVSLPDVRLVRQHVTPPPGMNALPMSEREWMTKIVRGRVTADSLHRLVRDEQFVPDVVLAHSGWGEALFVRDVLPRARLGVYCEYYYALEGGDTGFDPEFDRPADAIGNAVDDGIRLRLKNTHLLHSLVAADAGLSPTRFQRDRHPEGLRERIEVIHDGIDTQRFAPDPQAVVTLAEAGVTLRPGDEVITFVARNLEPHRGYHILMRALPGILAARPRARAVLVGAHGTGYGRAAPDGKSWKDIFLEEARAMGLDTQRVHFTGTLPHAALTRLMQVSAAHVYLTYPFVLSWSMLEAMSVGCLVIGSRTAPVEELITHGHNGLLVDFHGPQALARTVIDALADPGAFRSLREAARATLIEGYDLKRRCLPDQMAWVGRLAEAR